MISFLLTRDFLKLDQLFAEDKITLLFSQELLNEFIEVAQRPKFKKYFPKKDIQNLLIKIRTNSEFIIITSSVDLCRDKKDDFLLALAKDGKATHLITGDNDLLVLEKIDKTKILSMTNYLSKQ